MLFISDGCCIQGRGCPRKETRIYWTDDFLDNPVLVVRDAMAFAGVDPSQIDLEKVVSLKHNAAPKNHTVDPETDLLPELRKEMEKAMKPFNQELAAFLGETPPWMVN